MRALVFDSAVPAGLRLADVDTPIPTANQVLVAVHAVSLNSGEVRYLAESREPGEVPGWDAAGVVVHAAADGTGPPVGTRVTTFGWGGAWAETRAVDVEELAAVPAGLDLGEAATLPVAAVTALRALRALGPLSGRRVLVTGASGGVGRFATQLAARAGAYVIASVGRVERGAGLAKIGASEVVVGLEGVAPTLDGIIDNVGGPSLAEAFALLVPGGRVQAVGSSSGQLVTLDLEAERRRAGGTILQVMTRGAHSAADLALVLELLAAGDLDPHIGWRGPWTDVVDAVDALLGRRVSGKAVLDLRSEARS